MITQKTNSLHVDKAQQTYINKDSATPQMCRVVLGLVDQIYLNDDQHHIFIEQFTSLPQSMSERFKEIFIKWMGTDCKQETHC